MVDNTLLDASAPQLKRKEKEKAMKKVIIGVWAALLATTVWANCRYYSYTINGKTYYCTECCYGTGPTKQCNTTCN